MTTKDKRCRIPQEERRHKAVLGLIRSGLVTVGEAAELRGISRQAMYRFVDMQEQKQARQRYLKKLWGSIVAGLG